MSNNHKAHTPKKKNHFTTSTTTKKKISDEGGFIIFNILILFDIIATFNVFKGILSLIVE